MKNKVFGTIALLVLGMLLAGCDQPVGPSESNAYLKSLAATGVTLSPSFAYAKMAYTGAVPYATGTTVVTAETYVAEATVVATKDDAPYVLGTSSALKVGANVFKVVVTSQDASAVMTYTLTVTRGAAIATLDSLGVSGAVLAPAFSPAVTAYAASVANETATVTVTATTTDPAATVAATLDSEPYVPGTLAALDVGPNVFVVNVTAADGTTTKAYTLTVRRAEVVSVDASLATLAVSGADLVPAFNPDQLAYAATVPHTTAEVTLTAQATVAGAVVAATLDEVAYVVGTAAAVGYGEHEFAVVVTALDGTTTRTYSVRVTRLLNPSTDATLASLVLSGTDLVPTFDPGTTAYAATVPNATSSISLTAAASAAGATVTATFRDSGYTLGAAAALQVGANAFVVTVTADDDATTQDYEVTVTREAPGDLTVTVELTEYDQVVFSGQASSLAKGQTWTVLASIEGATAYAWYMDNVQKSDVDGAYLVIADDLAIGPHKLGLQATAGGIGYFGSISFMVEESPPPAVLTVDVVLADGTDLAFVAPTDTIRSGQCLVFEPAFAGATTFDWYLDTVFDQAGPSYVASADALAAGVHRLTASATVGGILHAGTFQFNVIKDTGPGSVVIIVLPGTSPDLELSGLPPDATLHPGQVWNLVPGFTDAESYAWHIDASVEPMATTTTFSLAYDSIGVGHHTLTLAVVRGGFDYTKTIGFDVVNE